MTTQTVTSSDEATFAAEDVGNIMLLEHVNVQQPDQAVATLFYLVGMGFTRDPHMMVGLENMWVNLGEQQFHLPTNTAQVLRGHIGIVTPSLPALAERLTGVAPRLTDTEFAWSDKETHIDVTGPWGNLFRCYEPSAEFGNIRSGIPYVELKAPLGSAEGIALFYQRVLLTPANVREDADGKAAVVDIGQYQHLIFRETADVPDYDGHHIAIYVADFSKPYQFLAARGLVTEEPRNHQFRFVDIVHPDTGETLYRLEHEVRGMRHGMYRRPLVNRSAGEFLEPRRVGNTTVFGTVM
jgi:hypothetical protein